MSHIKREKLYQLGKFYFTSLYQNERRRDAIHLQRECNEPVPNKQIKIAVYYNFLLCKRQHALCSTKFVHTSVFPFILLPPLFSQLVELNQGVVFPPALSVARTREKAFPKCSMCECSSSSVSTSNNYNKFVFTTSWLVGKESGVVWLEISCNAKHKHSLLITERGTITSSSCFFLLICPRGSVTIHGAEEVTE